jgi:hypothetical protein
MSGKTIFDARAHVACMRALADAGLHLGKARDLTVMATGNSLAGASIQVLYEAAIGLLNEMGSVLLELRNAEDADTRAFVHDVIAHFHAAAETGSEA